MISGLLNSLSLGPNFRSRVDLANAAWICVICGLGLSLLGVYAIDVGMNPEAGGELAARAVRQLEYLAIGLLAALMIAVPHYRLIGYLAWPAMVAVIGLLVFLLIPFVPESIVKAENGARAWIKLGFADFQPSEVAKIAFVLCTARYLRFRRAHRTLPGLLPPGIIAAVPVGLIMLEPDLGTAILFIPSLFAMLLAAGAKLKHLTIVVLVAALAGPAAYPLLKPHQKARIEALITQAKGERQGAEGINYQSTMAKNIAGAGGIAGMNDPHTRTVLKFNYLPARHNDFVFSVILSRFGLLGGAAVLLLYIGWFAGAMLVAGLCKDPFGRLTVVGLAAFIGAQMFVNIGMNIGLLPVIGITLPFVSYGGSSMLAVWMIQGLIFNVAMRKPIPPFRQSFEYDDE